VVLRLRSRKRQRLLRHDGSGGIRRARGPMTKAALLLFTLVGLLVTSPAAAQGATTSGAVSGFGAATPMGSPPGARLAAPLVGIASTPDGKGYWLLGADGGVFTYGDAGFFGSEGGSGLQAPIVGMAPTPTGKGYWLVTNIGNVYPFGDATQYGGAGRLNAPVVDMAATPTGKGYWLAAADGGVFSFGDAPFYGSMGGKHLNAPVVGMAATPTGKGYWLVAADGGVFSFGDARFFGSLGGTPPSPSTPVVGLGADPSQAGYWLTTTDRPLPPSGPVPSVWADCNMPGSAPAVEPSMIMLACGDGNAYLNHLTWSSWTSSGAAGVGDYTHNLCQPTCAQGTFVSERATVRLSYPIETGAGLEFSELGYTVGGATYLAVFPTSPY